MRVEVEHFVYYYHFYDRVSRIEVKKPHKEDIEEEFDEPIIRRFIKSVSDETLVMIETEMNNLIERLSKKFGVEFKIVEDEY